MSSVIMKCCITCNRSKSLDAFDKRYKNKLHGVSDKCKACFDEEKKKITDGKHKSIPDINETYTENELKIPVGFYDHCRILLKSCRKKAKKRNFVNELTHADLLSLYDEQQGLCALSNQVMTFEPYDDSVKEASIHNMSVDRIDSSKPYTKDNIQLVCTIVNYMKRDLQLDNFYELCERVATHNQSAKI